MLAEPFDGKTVVVTRHAPSSRSIHPRYASDLLPPAFAGNLENLWDGYRLHAQGMESIFSNLATRLEVAIGEAAAPAADAGMPESMSGPIVSGVSKRVAMILAYVD